MEKSYELGDDEEVRACVPHKPMHANAVLIALAG